MQSQNKWDFVQNKLTVARFPKIVRQLNSPKENVLYYKTIKLKIVYHSSVVFSIFLSFSSVQIATSIKVFNNSFK